MANPLDGYSNEFLFSIFNCDSLAKVENKFGKEKVNELFAMPKHRYEIKHSNNAVIQSLAATLSDSPSYPLLILWTILGLLSFEIIPLTLLTIGIGMITLITGSIFFTATFRAIKEGIKKSNNEFKLFAIQLHVADELIERQYTIIHDAPPNLQHTIQSHRDFVLKSNFSDHNKLSKINKALGATMMVGSMLFGTYYLGVSGIVTAFGLTTVIAGALGGPLGIGIALILSFSVAAYIGYKHYQVYQHGSIIKKQKKEMTHTIEEKYTFCYDLQDMIEQQKHLHSQSIDKHRVELHTSPWHPDKTTAYQFTNYPIILANQQQRKNRPHDYHSKPLSTTTPNFHKFIKL